MIETLNTLAKTIAARQAFLRAAGAHYFLNHNQVAILIQVAAGYDRLKSFSYAVPSGDPTSNTAKLLRLGLLTRLPAGADARAVRYALTPPAMEIVEKIRRFDAEIIVEPEVCRTLRLILAIL